MGEERGGTVRSMLTGVTETMSLLTQTVRPSSLGLIPFIRQLVGRRGGGGSNTV